MRRRNFASNDFTSYGLCTTREETFTLEEAECIAEESSNERNQQLPVAVMQLLRASKATPQEQPDGTIAVDSEDSPEEWRIVGLWHRGVRYRPVSAGEVS